MIDTVLAQTTTTVALPGILDPINVLSWFGAWAFWGLLLVVLIESGVLFPVLPGDSLLFVAGMVVAAGGRDDIDKFASLWQLLLFIPIAAIIGGQIGYWIGRYVGTEMFKPDARFLKERYITEAHEFFEVRPDHHLPGTFRADRAHARPDRRRCRQMKFAVFTFYNVLGAIIVGCGDHTARLLAGPVRDRPETHRPIFILIVVLSVAPMAIEWYRRKRAARTTRRPRHRTPRPPRTPSERRLPGLIQVRVLPDHACIAIPAATPALMLRVDPNWAIDTVRSACRCACRSRRSLLTEQQHALARQVRGLQRYRSGVLSTTTTTASPAPRPTISSSTVVVHQMLVAVGDHRPAPVPAPPPDDVHRGGADAFAVPTVPMLASCAGILDGHVKRMPPGVDIGDDRLPRPVPVRVDDVRVSPAVSSSGS